MQPDAVQGDAHKVMHETERAVNEASHDGHWPGKVRLTVLNVFYEPSLHDP